MKHGFTLVETLIGKKWEYGVKNIPNLSLKHCYASLKLVYSVVSWQR